MMREKIQKLFQHPGEDRAALRLLFLSEALEPGTDTAAMILAAISRKHEIYLAQMSELKVARGRPFVSCKKLSAQRDPNRPLSEGKIEVHGLDEFALVVSRRSPPLTMDYLNALLILSQANPGKTCVANDPLGLIHASNRQFWVRYTDCVPETLITKDPADLKAFVNDVGKATVWPLEGGEGHAGFMLDPWDPNFPILLAETSQCGQRYVMVQKHIDPNPDEEKRLFLLKGELFTVVGRPVIESGPRGNMRSTAKSQALAPTDRDREIVERVSLDLRQLGLHFVALDLRAGYLMGVDTLNPSGLPEATQAAGKDLAQAVLDALVELAPRAQGQEKIRPGP